MNCISCNETMLDGKYICTTTDYRILDSNDDLVFIVTTHCGLPSDDDEVGDSQDAKYCTCGYYTRVF